MKVSFWKNYSELIGFFILTFLVLLMTITFIILTIFEINYWPCIVVVIFLNFVNFSTLFFEKGVLSKISISENGIEWIRLKKKIEIINWIEITEIKEKAHGPKNRYLNIITNKKVIEIDVTKKIYNAIMILCPYPNIKAKINSLPMMEYWKKKNKKLIEKQKKK